jgi:hypothetical protein
VLSSGEGAKFCSELRFISRESKMRDWQYELAARCEILSGVRNIKPKRRRSDQNQVEESRRFLVSCFLCKCRRSAAVPHPMSGRSLPSRPDKFIRRLGYTGGGAALQLLQLDGKAEPFRSSRAKPKKICRY